MWYQGPMFHQLVQNSMVDNLPPSRSKPSPHDHRRRYRNIVSASQRSPTMMVVLSPISRCSPLSGPEPRQLSCLSILVQTRHTDPIKVISIYHQMLARLFTLQVPEHVGGRNIMGVELGMDVIEASPSRNKQKDAVLPPVPDNLTPLSFLRTSFFCWRLLERVIHSLFLPV
jgi:hypothetical protein